MKKEEEHRRILDFKAPEYGKIEKSFLEILIKLIIEKLSDEI